MADKHQDATPASQSATYQAMLASVETICRDITAPDLDLDAMVGKIEQGYQLIKAMRARLEETKEKVEHLRLEFE